MLFRSYDNLEPIQWPVGYETKSGQSRLFSDGRFYTKDERARFISIQPPQLASKLSASFPLYLNTGRLRNQWHSMTRTGLSEVLAEDNPEPLLEINPEDAEKYKLTDGNFANIQTNFGSCILRVKVTPSQAKNSIFAPIHWTDENSSNARIGALVAPYIDPISGQPELKATPASITPVTYKWQELLGEPDEDARDLLKRGVLTLETLDSLFRER
mgnify:CR=1 FL=1